MRQINKDRIFKLFKKYGYKQYGENVSVLSHSFQSGLLAREENYSKELILAAFLHDIGHLLPLQKPGLTTEMGVFGIVNHEEIGARYLKGMNFPEEIYIPIKNHVATKRYLCAVDPNYYETLSEASKKTLAYQGGVMSEQEIQVFKSTTLFQESVSLRKIDDAAKNPDFEILESHWNYLELLLLSQEY